MRKSLSISLIIFLLISCSQQKESTSNKSENNSTKFQDSKKAQADSLDGYWLSLNYLEAIKNSKSPFEAQDFANKTSFFAFRIDKSRFLTDSAFLNAHDLHEGGYGSYLYFDSISNRFRNDIQKNKTYEYHSYFNEPFLLKPIDRKHLALIFLDKKKTEYFIKLDDTDQNIEKEVFNILFEGCRNFWNLETNKEVLFDKNLEIVGLDSNKTYSIGLDFAGGPPLCDYISTYNPETQKQNFYNFKFFGDTIRLIKGIEKDEYDFEFTGDTIFLVKKSK